MGSYVALLRAVNVGGTGKLPMADLCALCERAGFGAVQTYIASGNVVFTAPDDAATVQATLERALAGYAQKPMPVFIRSAAEIAAVLTANPFAHAAPNRIMAVFLHAPPPPDALTDLRHQRDEEIAIRGREIYIHYPAGMGQSKLKFPAAEAGTARNMNTVAKLAELAAALR